MKKFFVLYSLKYKVTPALYKTKKTVNKYVNDRSRAFKSKQFNHEQQAKYFIQKIQIKTAQTQQNLTQQQINQILKQALQNSEGLNLDKIQRKDSSSILLNQITQKPRQYSWVILNQNHAVANHSPIKQQSQSNQVKYIKRIFTEEQSILQLKKYNFLVIWNKLDFSTIQIVKSSSVLKKLIKKLKQEYSKEFIKQNIFIKYFQDKMKANQFWKSLVNQKNQYNKEQANLRKANQTNVEIFEKNMLHPLEKTFNQTDQAKTININAIPNIKQVIEILKQQGEISKQKKMKVSPEQFHNEPLQALKKAKKMKISPEQFHNEPLQALKNEKETRISTEQFHNEPLQAKKEAKKMKMSPEQFHNEPLQALKNEKETRISTEQFHNEPLQAKKEAKKMKISPEQFHNEPLQALKNEKETRISTEYIHNEPLKVSQPLKQAETHDEDLFSHSLIDKFKEKFPNETQINQNQRAQHQGQQKIDIPQSKSTKQKNVNSESVIKPSDLTFITQFQVDSDHNIDKKQTTVFNPVLNSQIYTEQVKTDGIKTQLSKFISVSYTFHKQEPLLQKQNKISEDYQQKEAHLNLQNSEKQEIGKDTEYCEVSASIKLKNKYIHPFNKSYIRQFISKKVIVNQRQQEAQTRLKTGTQTDKQVQQQQYSIHPSLIIKQNPGFSVGSYQVKQKSGKVIKEQNLILGQTKKQQGNLLTLAFSLSSIGFLHPRAKVRIYLSQQLGKSLHYRHKLDQKIIQTKQFYLTIEEQFKKRVEYVI